MRRWMVRFAALVLTLAFMAGAAWAEEIVGTIQKVDQKLVVLEDGTTLWAPDEAFFDQYTWTPEGMGLNPLVKGTMVKASYAQNNGQRVLTRIEILSH